MRDPCHFSSNSEVGFQEQAVPFTNPTRLTFDVILPLWGPRDRYPNPPVSRTQLASPIHRETWLGRPPGTLGKSKLEGKQEEMKTLLALRVSKASIAKITDVDRTILYHFIRSRRLV